MKIYSPATIENVEEKAPDTLKLKWFEYAGRNIAFNVTFYHLLENYAVLYKKAIGSRFEHTLVRAKGNKWMMYRIEKEMCELKSNVKKYLKDKEKTKQILDEMEKAHAEFIEFCKNCKEENSIEYLKKFIKKQVPCPGAVSVCIAVCDAVSAYLEKQISDEDLIEIAVPHKPTLQMEQQVDLLKTLIKIKQEKLEEKKVKELLKKHYEEYAWVYFYVDDPITPFEMFLEQNEEIINSNLNILKQKLIKKQKFQEQVDKKIQKIIEKNALDQKLVHLFRRGLYLRIYGESAYGLGNKKSFPHFANIAKKLNLALNQIKYLTIEEMEAALNNKLDYEKLVTARQRDYAILLAGENLFVLNGEKSSKLMQKLQIEKAETNNSNEVKGTPAVKGIVTGIVKVVNEIDELEKVQKGDVLVTKNTTPTFVPAMRKAVAIVTDEGGITCHAAIVSRELGIPCIIGTGNGTLALKDGDLVEVNANNGVVKKK